MALDHPATVTRLAVINIVPTIDQFEQMGGGGPSARRTLRTRGSARRARRAAGLPRGLNRFTIFGWNWT
jgi:hypothetical protein